MANSRIPRFIMEVAPPQFITVTRHRTRKMMDTINEEDRDGTGYNDSLSAASSNSSAATNSVPAATLMAPPAATAVSANSKCFLNGMSSFSNSIIRIICFSSSGSGAAVVALCERQLTMDALAAPGAYP
ncbi:hypothetical protein V6N12_040035 [Hibiscus sabdariffa]|uniref:Uncharacterized protein n=1 Tax=Hibiscus sabdariffa TaxID=183260 RepID=A0ABR2E653_9ROSI